MKPDNIFVMVGGLVITWGLIFYMLLSKGRSPLYRVLNAFLTPIVGAFSFVNALAIFVALLPLEGFIYLIERLRHRRGPVRGYVTAQFPSDTGGISGAPNGAGDTSNVDRQSALIAARQTPSGRTFELRMTRLDSIVLSVAAVGLAFTNPVILTITALCHLLIGFFTAVGLIGKVGWLILTPIVTAAVFGILAGIGLAAERLGEKTSAFLDFSPAGIRWTTIIAINVGGIVALLFSYVGAADRLFEYQNKHGELSD